MSPPRAQVFDPEAVQAGALLLSIDGRLGRLETKFEQLIEIGVQQGAHASEIADLNRRVRDLEEEMSELRAAKKFASWIGLPGIAAICAGLVYFAKHAA